MIILQKYIFRDTKEISIGIPTRPIEKSKMFELRKNEYLKHNYTNANFKGGSDIDEFDETPDCAYFIASYNGSDKLIGTARLIRQLCLPTQKAFKFKEPEAIKKIKFTERAEVSRVVVATQHIKDLKIPQHLVMFGLFGAMVTYQENSDLQGGYAFIKSSLCRIFKKLVFPIHEIQNFQISEYPPILKGYFENRVDPPVPIYYLCKEVKEKLIPLLSFFLKKNGQSMETEANSCLKINFS